MTTQRSLCLLSVKPWREVWDGTPLPKIPKSTNPNFDQHSSVSVPLRLKPLSLPVDLVLALVKGQQNQARGTV
nr:hypothetical protein I308_05967 [Cryptococcus tetragattii IND107]